MGDRAGAAAGPAALAREVVVRAVLVEVRLQPVPVGVVHPGGDDDLHGDEALPGADERVDDRAVVQVPHHDPDVFQRLRLVDRADHAVQDVAAVAVDVRLVEHDAVRRRPGGADGCGPGRAQSVARGDGGRSGDERRHQAEEDGTHEHLGSTTHEGFLGDLSGWRAVGRPADRSVIPCLRGADIPVVRGCGRPAPRPPPSRQREHSPGSAGRAVDQAPGTPRVEVRIEWSVTRSSIASSLNAALRTGSWARRTSSRGASGAAGCRCRRRSSRP